MYHVYRFLNADDEVIYIGKTQVSMHKRMRFHSSSNSHLPKECYEQLDRVEYLKIYNKSEMDIKELYYINKWKPKFNTYSKAEESFTMEIVEDKKWRTFQSGKQDTSFLDWGDDINKIWEYTFYLVATFVAYDEDREVVKNRFEHLIDTMYDYFEKNNEEDEGKTDIKKAEELLEKLKSI